MADTNDGFGAVVKRYAFGVTTSSYGVSLFPGQNSVLLKLISGGTLEIVNGSTPAPTGLGWPLQSEVIGWDMRANLYVVASGATCVLAVIHSRSQGYTDV